MVEAEFGVDKGANANSCCQRPFGHFVGYFSAGVTDSHGVAFQAYDILAQFLKRGVKRQTLAEQRLQGVLVLKTDVVLLQKGFEIFLNALLAVKTNRVNEGRLVLASAHEPVRGGEVAFGLVHPFDRDLLHKALSL